MRFKGTLVLLLIFAVLGGYVYMTEFRGSEERAKLDAEKKRLFGGDAKDVVEMTLEWEGRTITAARKGEKDWELVSPAGIEADFEAWDQMASNFVQIEKDAVVSPESKEKVDLAPYGLDKPLVTLGAKLKDGTAPGVHFGSENPKKTFNYAKRTDSDEVFLSATSWSGLFKKSLTDLRNKKVLDFETEGIDLIRITAAGKPEIEIKKSGEDWVIEKPIQARADAGEVSSFLSTIQFTRAPGFATDDAGAPMDAKATGVEVPAVRVTLHDAKAAGDRTLVFGKSPEKDKYYAKDVSRAPIFILGTEIYEKTQRPLLEWRDRSVVRLEGGGSAVDEVEITRGTDKIVLKKSGTEWRTADGKQIQALKVDDMLSGSASARSEDILDKPGPLGSYGLDKPRLSVSLRQAGKELESLRFGRDSSKPEGVYLKASGPTVTIVPRELLDKFDVKLSDLLEVATNPEPAAK